MKNHPTKLRAAVFILAVCVVPLSGIGCSAVRSWRRIARDTNEQTLRTDLVIVRKAIRNYATKRGEMPQSLKDLTAEGAYLTVPDPITGLADWQVTIGEDPALLKGKRGIINVHSASTAMSSQGTPYNSW